MDLNKLVFSRKIENINRDSHDYPSSGNSLEDAIGIGVVYSVKK